MTLEIALYIAAIIYLIVTYLQHLKTQKLLRDLSICVGYNISFLSRKHQDYVKTPQEK